MISKLVDKKSIEDFLKIGTKELTKSLYYEQNPDYSLIVEEEGELLGRASLWWRKTPLFNDKKTGYIGHISYKTDMVLEKIISEAEEILKNNGCHTVIGPIDGSTWYKYRLCSTNFEIEPFFLEPFNNSEILKSFKKNGYNIISKYNSYKCNDLAKTDTRIQLLKNREFYKKISLSSLNLENFENELKELYEISMNSFNNNILFSTIKEEQFINLYKGFKEKLDQKFLLIASYNGKKCGFVFGYPDYNELKYKGKIETIILKTLAVLPEYQGMGIASLMAEEIHKRALNNGYTSVIHALMQEKNVSKKMAGIYGTVFREYLLFGKEI